MRKRLNEKGQFSIIAALLVSIVLVAAIVTTFTILRNNPLEKRPQVLGAIDEMNLAIDRILEFSVGYYGSILQVTGNTTYARNLASVYMQRSLENLADEHPNWSPFFYEVSQAQVSATWFNRTSTSMGVINVTYSLAGLGISGIQYSVLAGLEVTVNRSNNTHILVNVSRDGDRPYPNLGKDNFFFYNYSYAESIWHLSNIGLKVNSITSSDSYSVYNITVPNGIDSSAYMLQVVDSRGIVVSASTFSQYIYTFNWNQTLYSSLTEDTIVVEVLQNGTLKWLGQNLEFTTTSKPVPPIPVKAFRINQTVDGVNHEVPFQVEDWCSEYQVPAGLTSNASIFGSRQMFVFLVDHNVENTILWWDGRDITTQTSRAFTNLYFTGDDPDSRTLTNGILTLTFSSSGFTASSSLIGSSITSMASFFRVNGENPVYGASPAYVIHHGIVRDVVQQEAEWSGGVDESPNMYGHIVLMLPANATYYTYALRPTFVDSVQTRTITDFNAIRLEVPVGEQLTENGTSGGYPITSNAASLFYNLNTSGGWAHHWSEYISLDEGAGIMFTNKSNHLLYYFDSIIGENTGALNIIPLEDAIEYNPIEMTPVTFQYALEVSWHGAVVSFDGTDTIYPSSGTIGLWVLVESLPIITLSFS